MKTDELENLYEAVRSPKAKTSGSELDKDNKKNTAGKLTQGEDFGFNKKGVQKGTGPEAVKGLNKPKKGKGTLNEETDMNTNTPEVGSQFDKLFASTLSEEFEEAGNPAAPDMGGDDMGDFPSDSDMDPDAGGDDTEGEVSLKSELGIILDRIQTLYDNIESDDEENPEDSEDFESGEDMDAGDDQGGIEGLETSSNNRPFGEARRIAMKGKGDAGMHKTRDGKLQKAPDGKGGLQGKNNKVSGYYGKDTMSGKADTGMSKPRDGVLRPAPSGYGGLQGKNNKVDTTSVMSKTGSSLFD